MTRPQFHVAIVGAGLGGLAAAIAIARAGDRVTVLEQAPVLGEVQKTTPLLFYFLFPCSLFIFIFTFGAGTTG